MSQPPNDGERLNTTQEIAPLVPLRPKDTPFPALQRNLRVSWHRITSAISKGGWSKTTSRILYVLAYAWVPIAAIYHLGAKTSGPVNPTHVTWFAVAILVWGQVSKAVKDAAPQNMQFLERNYTTRKYSLSKLIQLTIRKDQLSPSEIQRFREDGLDVIAHYVRDHRADWMGRRIFANLLVRDDDDVVVLARNETGRANMVRYPKAQMAATTVLERGVHVCVGDVAAQYPGHPAKPYSSFLILPIYLDGAIVGAVSIDSSEKYHFDFESDELSVFLLPYISLLAWTLAEKHVKAALAGDAGQAVGQ